MDPAFEKSCEIIDRDLSAEWLDLSSRVRQLALNLSNKAHGTALQHEANELANEASQLCNHVERLHGEVASLISELGEQVPLPEREARTERPIEEDGDIDQENLKIRSEQHELRADFRDVLKALFMWKDDPVERTRGKKSVI